jgi:hypothetical protein
LPNEPIAVQSNLKDLSVKEDTGVVQKSFSKDLLEEEKY